jgi:hypothetical protein
VVVLFIAIEAGAGKFEKLPSYLKLILAKNITAQYSFAASLSYFVRQ